MSKSPLIKIHLPFDVLTFNDGHTTSIDLSRFIYTIDDPTTLEKGAAYIRFVSYDTEKESYVIEYSFNEDGIEQEYSMPFDLFMRYLMNGDIALVAATEGEKNDDY